MSEEAQHQGGEPQEKPRLGFRGMLAVWLASWEAKALKRDKRRPKGKQPPTKGVVGPINHDEEGHPWFWMEAETVPGFQLMTHAQKQAFAASFQSALKSLEGFELDIQVQALPFDPDKLNKDLQAAMIGRPDETIRRRHAQSRTRAMAYIKKKGYKQRHCFIGVKMSEERMFLVRMLSQLMLWMGFSSLLSVGYEDRIYHDQIQHILGKFRHNNVPVKAVTGAELARIIQHCVYRGQGKQPQLTDDSGVIQHAGALKRLTSSSAQIPRDRFGKYHPDVVEVIQKDGSSRYVSYLAVAKLPDDFSMSWMFAGDNKHRPVEVSARIKIEDRAKAKAYNQTTIRRIQTSIEDLAKNGTDSESEIDQQLFRKEMAEGVNARYEQGDTSAEVNAFLIVSDDDVPKLKDNRSYVIERSSVKGLDLEMDATYISEIRRQTYPGARITYTDYEQHMFLDGVADAMPHASSTIGGQGDLLGVVAGLNSVPFIYAHRMTVKEGVDTKPGQIYWGPSGEGKTTAMINDGIGDALSNMATIYDGGKEDVLILEGEHDMLVDIKMMDLTSPDTAGLLNPLYLGEDSKESRDLTFGMFWKWAGSDAPQQWRSLLAEAITDELNEHPNDPNNPDYGPDITRIVKERLYNSDRNDPNHLAKRDLGRTLMDMLETKYSDVVTAKGKPWQEIVREYIRRGQMTFVIYGKLKPPGGEKADNQLSGEERLALLVRDITNVVYYKIAMDPSIPAAIYKDELHIDNRMGGSRFSEYLGRTARYAGSTINLGDQTFNSFPSGFLTNCSTYNIFKLSHEKEARQAMEILGIHVKEDSDEELTWINLILGKHGSGRQKYDVLTKTWDGPIGLVARKQFNDDGRFVSNMEAVERRKRQKQALASGKRVTYIARQPTAEAAELALLQAGVSQKAFSNTNGYKDDLDQWMFVIQNLDPTELVVVVDGKLVVVKDTERTPEQLPMVTGT